MSITVEQIAELLLAAEESGERVLHLAWHLLSRDPFTRLRLGDLRQMGEDAGLSVESQHWALSAIELSRQADILLRADGRRWGNIRVVLDPVGDVGVDYLGLANVIAARMARVPWQSGDRHRRLLKRLRQEGS